MGYSRPVGELAAERDSPKRRHDRQRRGSPDASVGAALYDQRKADLGKDDTEARCLPPGVPRMTTTPYPWTFVQTKDLLVIVYEGGAHVWRKIFLDGRPYDPRVEFTWLGDSIGRWEGDTLVIETVGQNEITWIDAAGIPHSTDMKVIERILRPDFGHLEIEHIIDDPKTFSKPWSFTTRPSLLCGQLIEYICQENEKDWNTWLASRPGLEVANPLSLGTESTARIAGINVALSTSRAECRYTALTRFRADLTP